MAKAEVKLPEELLNKLSRLGQNTDVVAEKVLQAGGKVVLDKVRDNLESVIGSDTKRKSRSTGELLSSLGLSPVLVNRNGNHDVKIGFAEPRSDGESNAKLANILEYGKSGQPPKPFLQPAENGVEERMQARDGADTQGGDREAMSLLSEVKQVVEQCDIPVETGVFSDVPPDTYAVLTPLSDSFDIHADNKPGVDVQEVRLSLFCKENYLKTKNTIIHALIAADITITNRRYIGHEDDTGYHHYAIDVAKSYIWED